MNTREKSLQDISIEEIDNKVAKKESFVLNLVASWCPDCTEKQAPNLPAFEQNLMGSELSLYNIVVQHNKGEFLSAVHQGLVEQLGGHGYPRTVLFVSGQAIDTDNVEITSIEQLAALADKFKARIKKPA
ncbi:TlpA family protein disulfide reductase [Planctobacterium marinum]|uniref:Thioredoxin domain-containing protein n=1 Tax=Planctobacterium marinum TaxID=1631968 RepID=A0AA48KQ08_9ALTE|nr:hypothetical protein MACH26_27670 [Planctobacterium marinum]